MDAMHLRALEEEPDPTRCPDVGVVEEVLIFTSCEFNKFLIIKVHEDWWQIIF